MKYRFTAFVTFIILALATGLKAEVESSWTQKLYQQLEGVDRLHIRSGGTCHRGPESEKTLLDLRDAEVVSKVLQNIQITPNDSGFHCMCCGDPTLEFYRGETLVVSLGFHHARSLRWLEGKWKGDGLLTQESADFLVKWMDDQGVSGPRNERDEMEAIRIQSEQDWNRWVAAMPESLEPIWEDSIGSFGDVDTKPLSKALKKEYPNQTVRILALFKWNGSGAGPWSGFPSYESAAEELLLEYEAESLIEAIGDIHALSPTQVEGAARFFGGWSFSKKQPDGRDQLPDSFKEVFWNHVKDTKDEDKLSRAEHAFKKKV